MGGAFGFLGQVASGIVNQALSEHNANVQRDWQWRMWNAQNAYNDPSAMANRMRAAGLNPFSMTGAQPAGSVGTGAMAQTFPMPSPLDALRTIAEVENINASTNRIETETDKLLKEMVVLDIEAQHGLLSNQEYERRLKEMFKEWDNRNPYTVDADNKESQTDKNNADAALSRQLESESVVRQSNIGFENQLLQKRIAWFDQDHQAAIDQIKASIQLMDAQTQNYVVQTDNLELLSERIEFVNACSNFVGFDVSNLPPATLTQVLGYYRDALRKLKSPQEALRNIFDVIFKAGNHERAILESRSESGQLSVFWGTASGGTSSSSTTNVNK